MIGLIRALFWEVRMELTSTFRYRFGVISDIVVFSALLAFFLTSGTGTSFADKYQYQNSKALFLLGYIAWILAVSAISSIGQSVSVELQRGTFYKKMHSIYPLQFLLFGQLIAGIFIETIIATVLVLLSRLVWNVDTPFGIFIVVSILISTIGMYGIGLTIAGLSIYYKHTGAIVFLVQLGLLFITDTIPSNSAILSATKFLPLTICNDIIRKYLSGGNIDYSFLALIISSAVFLFVGILVFSVFVRQAKKRGNLLFY